MIHDESHKIFCCVHIMHIGTIYSDKLVIHMFLNNKINSGTSNISHVKKTMLWECVFNAAVRNMCDSELSNALGKTVWHGFYTRETAAVSCTCGL